MKDYSVFRAGLRVLTLMMFAATNFAFAQTYSIIDLGDLPGGNDSSFARGINDNGQVASHSTATHGLRAFRWDSGEIQDLDELSGGNNFSLSQSINNSGQVVGVSGAATGNRAFLWDEASGIIDLGDLAGGENFSEAQSINDKGQVVGYSGATSGYRAFLWDAGTLTDLGDLTGGSDFSIARGINNGGQTPGDRGDSDTTHGNFPHSIDASSQVVGVSSAVTGNRAFLWIDGEMTDLGDLAGGSDFSDAFGINDNGQVVGVSSTTTGNRAFLWENGAMVDLGDLEGGVDFSSAIDINDAGTVVGVSNNVLGNRAFVWDNANGMQDLNDLLDLSGTGWTLSEAYSINSSGQIVGNGINPNGVARGFVLTPNAVVPEPRAVSLMGLLAIGWITRRRRRR